jgi:hypothetical protein
MNVESKREKDLCPIYPTNLFTTSLCSRTALFSEAQEDLNELGAGNGGGCLSNAEYTGLLPGSLFAESAAAKRCFAENKVSLVRKTRKCTGIRGLRALQSARKQSLCG